MGLRGALAVNLETCLLSCCVAESPLGSGALLFPGLLAWAVLRSKGGQGCEGRCVPCLLEQSD
jgi:hypothetical protein